MGICLQQRAIKYRIYPTPEQEVLIQKTFGCCRFVWNHMLGDEQRFYEETDIHYIVTPAKYKKSFPFLNEVDSLALCNEQVNLQNAFAAFLGKHAAHPRFKSKKKSKKSYTTNIQRKAASIIANAIFLPKLKWVRAKIHRMSRTGWRLKNATVSQTASGKYFCSLCFEFNAVEPTLVAIDESLASLQWITGMDASAHTLGTSLRRKENVSSTLTSGLLPQRLVIIVVRRIRLLPSVSKSGLAPVAVQ